MRIVNCFSVLQQTLSSHDQVIFRKLSTQNQKIVAISLAVIASLVAGLACFKYCCRTKALEDKKVVMGAVQKQVEEERPLVDLSKIETPTAYPCSKETHVYDLNADREEFKDFLFSGKKQQIPQIKVLLENTVAKGAFPTEPVHSHHFRANQNHLEESFRSPFLGAESKVTYVNHWFDYTDPRHFYIDFAHATSFGGAYDTFGCVQEERMFAEFTALPLLDFITGNGIHPCIDSYETGGHNRYPPHAKAYPFIIESIAREFDISKTPYGGKFQRASEDTIIEGIEEVALPVPVNIIGLAAVDWRGVKNPKYKLKDLIYHFEASYLANMGAKFLSEQRGWNETVIHTAPWGCGAFLNSEKMMTAIQYIAARKANVDLVLHGVGNPLNPHYTQKNIDEIIEWTSDLIDQGKSPEEILQLLFEKSQNDSTWPPRSRT